ASRVRNGRRGVLRHRFSSSIVFSFDDALFQRSRELQLFPMSATTTEQLRPPPPLVPEELVGSTAFLLGRLGYAIKSAYMAELEPAGFNPYHHSVLALLGE